MQRRLPGGLVRLRTGRQLGGGGGLSKDDAQRVKVAVVGEAARRGVAARTGDDRA